MIQYFIYLLEVSICLILFYVLYHLLVKNDTYHLLKRYYLLASIAFSLVIPQLPAADWARGLERMIVRENHINSGYFQYQDTFEKVVFGNIPEQFAAGGAEAHPHNILSIVVTIYLLGFMIMLFRFAWNLFHISELIRKNKPINLGKYKLVPVPDHYSTFSFFRYVFLNEKNLEHHEKAHVLSHEEIHVKQRHSADIILVEICKIVFWFNPIIWLYKKSLVVVHECIADECMLKRQNGNISDYQSLLLKHYISNINIELAHSFNYSLIKLRIKMMTKAKSKRWAKYKMLFALPVTVLGILAFSNTDVNFPTVNNSAAENEKPPLGMVYVPSGSFTLIRTDGNATREFDVTVKPFWMKETEVKVEEYDEYLASVKQDSAKRVYEAALPDPGKAPYKDYFTNQEYKKYPVVGVSLVQARDFCKWKTRKENLKLKSKGQASVADYRMPDEVEWIYASFGGKNPDEIVRPAKTGLAEIKRSSDNVFNGFGLLHMFGNVSEWTNTCYDPVGYMTDFQKDAVENLDNIIVRGENYKRELVSDKLVLDGNASYDYVGFRYVRSYLGKYREKTSE